MADKKYEVLGIIGARGGSKGIPKKNIRMLLGKPLMAWTIEEAKKSKLLTRLMVSTDSPEIAEVAKKYGAEVPYMQPKELATDLSTDVDFMTYALSWLKEHENYEPDIILRLPPTSPLRRAENIDAGIEKLIATPGADASRPIIEAEKHPFKFWKISADGKWLEPFLTKEFTGFEEPYNLPRQLFPKVYRHTGAMDVMWVRTMRDLKSTSGKKLTYFFMKPEESVNIDDELDFLLAELLLRQRLGLV